MKCLSISSELLGQQYWPQLPDGKAMKYDLKTIKINNDYITKNAFAIAIGQIGIIQENPAYVSIQYCTPAIKSKSWRSDCFQTAKEDVLFRNLVHPEFMEAFVDALS